jgi:hypothetical protein
MERGGLMGVDTADEEQAMTDVDRAEMRALCDQFRREMVRDVERTMFDKEACQRIGEVTSKAARQGRSDYIALRR